MKLSKKQYIPLVLQLPAIIIIAGAVGWLLLYWVFPAIYFRWYPVIPVYFTLLGIALSIVMSRYSKRKPVKIMMVYLLSRAIKIVLTAGGFFLYYGLIGEDTTAMLLTTLVFYLLFLFIETWVFYRFEKMTHQTRGHDA